MANIINYSFESLGQSLEMGVSEFSVLTTSNSPITLFTMLVLALVNPKVENTLLTVLIQLVVIIVVARVFAAVFRWFRQPSVVGEIAAGLLLGPSFLGKFFPEASLAVFDPSVNDVFAILSQLGLILLLFLVGLEFDFSHLKWHGKAALAISGSGIVLPFAFGDSLAPFMHPHLEEQVPYLGFVLFMGTAMSITAIPVLGRMMMELGITRTRIGTVTISAAAVDDACGWIILATVASIVQSKFQIWVTMRMIAATIVYFLVMLYIVRPMFKSYLRAAMSKSEGKLTITCVAVVLVALFLSSIATNLIGIFAIFGAFIFGTMLSDDEPFREAISVQLRNFVTALFLPIFFTYTGLRTDIGTLNSPLQWMWCGLVLAAAIVGKWVGCSAAARLGGFPKREAICIGIMMNTRGLMELIVISVGRDLGVISPSVFCMLVLMALITTIMATPILLRAMPGTELEQPIRDSGFLQR